MPDQDYVVVHCGVRLVYLPRMEAPYNIRLVLSDFGMNCKPKLQEIILSLGRLSTGLDA